MLKSDIYHTATLNAIEKYNITDDMIEQLENIQELRKYIANFSRRVWQRKNKSYYKERYNLVKNNAYEPGMKVKYESQNNEKPLTFTGRPSRTREYIRNYNKEYYQKRKERLKAKKKSEIILCEKCCQKQEIEKN
jgi:hypothetical protein